MAGNSKEIKVISTAKGKQNPYAKDVIYDSEGQWKYPGQVTKVPSGDITMQGVPYPVLGIDDLGNEQMMYPGLDYSFPGQSVTEYPQSDEEMRYGGLKKNKRKTSKNIFTSVNDLFRRNETLYGKPGRRFYDPNYKEQGGTMNNNYFQTGGLSRSDDFGSKSNPYPSVSSEDFAGGGRSYPIPTKADAIDALRLAGLHNRSDVRAKIFAKYPDLRKEFGGELSEFIHSIAKKQFGGMDEVESSAAPATSIDSITGEKKNFFNNYIRNNVSKAMADQLQQEMMNQHMMPDGNMMADSQMQYPYGGGVEPVNPNYIADSMATVNYAQQHPELFDPNRVQFGINPNDGALRKFPIKNGVQGRAVPIPTIDKGKKKIIATGPYAGAENERALKWSMNQQQLQSPGYDPNNTPQQFPDLFGVPPVQQMGGEYYLPKAQFGTPLSQQTPIGWGSSPAAPKPECSEEEKMTPGTDCYNKFHSSNSNPFGNAGESAPIQKQGYENSTPQGSFGVQGNQTADPYGKMPQANPYYSSTPTGMGQETTPLGSMNNPIFNSSPTAPQAPVVDTTTMDPNQMRTDAPLAPTPENTSGPGSSFSVSFDGRKTADALIGGMNMVSSFLEGRDRRKQEKKRNLSGDAIFQPMPEQSGSRGDYDPNSGMFRPNQMIPIQYAGTNYGNIGSNMYAQYGGPMDENDEGVYMDENEIAQILAMGGTITYLD